MHRDFWSSHLHHLALVFFNLYLNGCRTFSVGSAVPGSLRVCRRTPMSRRRRSDVDIQANTGAGRRISPRADPPTIGSAAIERGQLRGASPGDLLSTRPDVTLRSGRKSAAIKGLVCRFSSCFPNRASRAIKTAIRRLWTRRRAASLAIIEFRLTEY